MKKFIIHLNYVLFLTSAMVFIASLLSTTQEAFTVTIISTIGLVLSLGINILVWCYDRKKGNN
jgi:hypothetical protein